jgi:hypothetical protein
MLHLSRFAEIGKHLRSVSTDVEGFKRFIALRPDLQSLQAEYEQLPVDDRQDAIELILAPSGGGLFARIAQLSFAAKLSGEPRYIQALAGPEFDQAPEAIQYFLNWQIGAYGFINFASIDGPTLAAVQARYLRIVRNYADGLGLNLPFVPPADRDWDRVVLMTGQMLGPLHGPTFDALDYSARLARSGKRPLLINNCLYPRTLPAPFYAPVLGNHSTEREGLDRIVHDGVSFDFHQITAAMPDQGEIVRLTKALYAARPGYVISMGHSNLLADLCGAFTTTIGMPFGTQFQFTAAAAYVLPRPWRDGDEVAAAERGLTRDLVLAQDYRFTRPPAVRVIDRKAIGAPEGAIIIAVVGTRLDTEATPAWMEQLGEVLDRNPDLVVVFAGVFGSHAERISTHASLAQRTKAVGLLDDVPAFLECCDLYLNPPRQGGASTAAYALAAGAPVMTDPNCDVAGAAGDTALPGLDGLDATVRRWREDPVWRAELSERAKRRWVEISDRDDLLRQIDDLARAHADRRAPVFQAH